MPHYASPTPRTTAWLIIPAIMLAVISALAAACSGTGPAGSHTGLQTVYEPRYAHGFAIMGNDSMLSTVLQVYNPWQGAEGVTFEYFVARGGEEAPADFAGKVIKAGARRIVCMSSSYVAMLDALGAVERIVAVSGLDYVSNPQVNARRGEIKDIGAEPDPEAITALHPDLVLLYGIRGAQSSVTAKLDEIGIPYVYMGEYLEESPLGKAEWLVALAELLGCRDAGERAFAPIPHRYDSLCAVAARASSTPRVMVNAPWSDTWYMPSAKSYVVRLIEDAGGEYVMQGNETNASSTIGMETALALLRSADIWLDAGHVPDIAALTQSNPLYAGTPPVKSGRVYNSDLRTNSRGANDFWESAVIHPDIVLADLIAIIHPELADGHRLYYYRRLAR